MCPIDGTPGAAGAMDMHFFFFFFFLGGGGGPVQPAKRKPCVSGKVVLNKRSNGKKTK